MTSTAFLDEAEPVKFKNPCLIMKPLNYETFISLTREYIVAGGSWQTQVKLFKPDTKEVCNLPNLPEYFSHSSMDLVDGTPVLCGSWFGSPGKSRMKYL